LVKWIQKIDIGLTTSLVMKANDKKSRENKKKQTIISSIFVLPLAEALPRVVENP